MLLRFVLFSNPSINTSKLCLGHFLILSTKQFDRNFFFFIALLLKASWRTSKRYPENICSRKLHRNVMSCIGMRLENG